MTPDRGFRRQLHILDKELDVVWDWGSEKWEIWRFPEDGTPSHHVLTVQTKDKNYRELGADILLRLQQIDSRRFTLKQLIAYFEELDNQVERRKKEDLKNRLEAMAGDNRNFIYRLMGKPIAGKTIEGPGWLSQGKVIDVPKEVKIGRIIRNA